MRSVTRSLAGLVVVALTACSGGGHSSSSLPATAQAPAPNGPTSSSVSGPIAYGQAALAGASLVGPATLSNVDFGVLVKLRDPVGLARYAQDANDPHSGLYHHFLTPDQIADQFGATKSDYQAVRAYFAGKGVATAGWRQRELIRVSGSQAAVENALGAKFGIFTKNGRQFHGLTSAPAALAKLPVAALVGAVNYAQIVSGPVRATGATPPTVGGYSPQQIATAFDYNGAYIAGYTGAGVTIGIIGTGPISPNDLATYKSIYHLTGSSTVTQINVTDAGSNAGAGASNPPGYTVPPGTFASPPPTTDFCGTPLPACNPEDAEAQLDTQQTAGLARDANVLFYLGYAPNGFGPGIDAEGIALVSYEMQQAISDNRADILSLSFGVGERDDVGFDFNVGADGNYDPATSVGPAQFATLAAMGVAVFVSSGDSGALGCARDGGGQPMPNPNVDSLCVSYPATDPNVVALGGVNAALATDGHLVGPMTGWGLQTGLGQVTSASGGGISQYFPLPPYQTGAVGISGSKRNTPDISLLGDPRTGAATVVAAAFPDGFIGRFGGTSVAAPQSAAMWALVLQACKANAATCKANPGTGGVAYRLGNPDPMVYGIYANAAQYAATFTDVLFGDNSQNPGCTDPGQTGSTPCPSPAPTLIPGYQAGVGYDRITGIGVPAGRALIRAVVGI